MTDMQDAPYGPTLGPPPARWPASWIRHPSAQAQPTGVYHFRKSFEVPELPASFAIRVSADNRYELFVNGVRASRGPARGDLQHWRYERVDVAPHLRAGRNVLAAVVWYHGGEMAPMAQMTYAPGFVVCGDDGDEAAQAVNTPAGWRTTRNEAYDFHRLDWREVMGYFVVGPAELVDAARYPWGWEQPDFDDSAWDEPAQIAPACPRGCCDAPSYWLLMENPLPPQEDAPGTVTTVRRAEGIEMGDRLAPDQPARVAAGTRATLLLDNRVLTTAYPELSVRGGRGATVRLRYAEAMDAEPQANRKTHRDDVDGKRLFGNWDAWTADGGDRVFRPLWWRTFRYVQVEVETAEEPVEIAGLAYRYTGYPFTERGRFAASDTSLARVWEVGWRTARLCAHETYMDCPYFEQLQYGGDTRIQCLVSLYAGGDDRLVRSAIAQLDDSRIAEGITQSRYPSRLMQLIPPFSLWWVGMVHDYWMYRDDRAFVRSMLPGIRSVLDWYFQRCAANNLLGPLPWWNFVDWVRAWRNGVPPGADEGGGSIVTLQFVLALREAARIERALGTPANALRYQDAAQHVADAVLSECWDDDRGLLADDVTKQTFSQHANAFAILAGLFDDGQRRAVASKLLAEPADAVRPATFYCRFYVHRALREAGLGDRYLEWLAPWRTMLDMGLTTWAENPEPTRSDCHAWSAHPNVDLLATVLGVESAGPGFSRVSIAPHLGSLQWAEGSVPHPRGEVIVKLRRSGEALEAEVTLPPGTKGEFRWAGAKHALQPGRQTVTV